MSQIDASSGNEQRGELLDEENSDNDDYETEEEELLENISPGIPTKKKKKRINFKTRSMRLPRLTISLRNRKSSRENKAKKQIQKLPKKKFKRGRRISSSLKKKIPEKRVEAPKLGKRCRFGGKAKVKPPPPPMEIQEKHDSEDDSDSAYLSRISLGQYQQLKDKSGASTSYQTNEEEYCCCHDLSLNKNHNEYSEEEELRELQSWGRNVLNTYYCVVRNWRNYRELFEHMNK